MSPDKLARMAGEIAAFFRPYPEEVARAGVRDHLVAFWTPAMRATLVAKAKGLDPLVEAALRDLPRSETRAAKEGAPG
jgi:formate dehydrogenase subunit delta